MFLCHGPSSFVSTETGRGGVPGTSASRPSRCTSSANVFSCPVGGTLGKVMSKPPIKKVSTQESGHSLSVVQVPVPNKHSSHAPSTPRRNVGRVNDWRKPVPFRLACTLFCWTRSTGSADTDGRPPRSLARSKAIRFRSSQTSEGSLMPLVLQWTSGEWTGLLRGSFR
jgi:hypothetical protein